MIKQQFEQIIKDAKILCELEPFVKKWSFDEMLPHFQPSSSINEDNNSTLAEISRDVKLAFSDDHDDSDGSVRARLVLRQLREKTFPKGYDDDPSHPIMFGKAMDNILPEDQYDQELEKTLKALEEIEVVEAVTQTDIDDFVRGLGGKPDGLDLKTTNIREWKNILLEHWFDLNHLAGKSSSQQRTNNIGKQWETLPNIISRTKSSIKRDRYRDVVHSEKNTDRLSMCTSSRVNLHGHFMTRKERKNMDTSFNLHVAQGESAKNGLGSPSSPYVFAEYYEGGVGPDEKEKSLLTLRQEHHETSLPHMGEKTASSALIGRTLLRYKKLPINDCKASGDNFYGDRERQTKKMGQNSCSNELKFKAETARGKKNTSKIYCLKDRKATASVRPSTAPSVQSPNDSIVGGVSKFTLVKGKIR